MNKPASELIALDKAGLDAAVRECARITAPEISDEEYEKIVAEDSLRYRNTRLDMERTILAYLSAAIRPGSERAGVDALREALMKIAFNEFDSFSGDPSKWPSTIAYIALGGSIINGQRVTPHTELEAALATPPAQPAPAGDNSAVETK